MVDTRTSGWKVKKTMEKNINIKEFKKERVEKKMFLLGLTQSNDLLKTNERRGKEKQRKEKNSFNYKKLFEKQNIISIQKMGNKRKTKKQMLKKASENIDMMMFSQK